MKVDRSRALVAPLSMHYGQFLQFPDIGTNAVGARCHRGSAPSIATSGQATPISTSPLAYVHSSAGLCKQRQSIL